MRKIFFFHQESRSHRIKPSFDEDYYSSDEDTFLDRTGVVEQKRLAKMREKSSSNVETHESLVCISLL